MADSSERSIVQALAKAKNWRTVMTYLFGPDFTKEQFHDTVEGFATQTLSTRMNNDESLINRFMFDLTDIQQSNFTVALLGNKMTKNAAVKALLTEVGVFDDPSIFLYFGRAGEALLVRLHEDYTVERLMRIFFDETPKGLDCSLRTTQYARETLGINSKLVKSYFNKHRKRTHAVEIGRLIASSKGTPQISRSVISSKIVLDACLYPNLPVGPKELLKQFMTSSSTCMYLVGSPGSGKSTLIRALAKTQEVVLVDDHRLLSTEMVADLGTRILDAPKGTVFVFEEIDAMLLPRSGGNQDAFIKMLLQVSSGIVKTKAKIVICTNSQDTARYDQALLRSDRNFGEFIFKDLTAEQANKVALYLKKPATYTKNVSLSDIFNGGVVVKKRQIGFGLV